MLYFSELLEIHQQHKLALKDKYKKIRHLLNRFCMEQTQQEALQFSNLFARIVFLSNKYGFDAKKQWQLQNFRIQAQTVIADKYLPSEDEYLSSLKIVAEFISFISKIDINEDLQKILPHRDTPLATQITKVKLQGEEIDKIKVEVIRADKEQKILYCKADNNEENVLEVKYNILGINEIFTESLDKIWIGCQLNLLQVRHDKAGYFVPQFFVIEPDYLIDVTAIAECNQKNNYFPELYILKKFIQSEKTLSILTGNLANYFLDELLNEKDENPLSFDAVFQKTFQLYPLDYTTQKDLTEKEQFDAFKATARNHFTNIKRTLNTRNLFGEDELNLNKCYLEPAFYSEKYGVQGRLDFLHFAGENDEKIDIFELKSSKSTPKDKGLWENHLSQTTLYQILMESVFDLAAKDIRPAILYSGATEDHLRFAPATKTKEKYLINLRNRIIQIEYNLANTKLLGVAEKILLSVEKLLNVDFPSFTQADIQLFLTTYKLANPLEKNYFLSFVNFTAREQLLAKIGDIEYDAANSHAGLWNWQFKDKQESFSILYDLEITDNQLNTDKPTITFARTNPENDFVNFREGDIAVLYPFVNDESNVLQNQIFKCTVVHINKQTVTVKVRFKQKNTAFFEKYQKWALEHDLMDTGFQVQFANLFRFLGFKNQEKKNLILGIKKPASTYPDLSPAQKTDLYHNTNLNTEQNTIIQKALATKDYFLLVGPPGTGKTSMILRNLTIELYKNPQTNILLLAYTNRAVDEICEAIAELDFIRIGSEYATTEKLRNRLLDKKIAACKSRAEIKEVMQQSRILVATIAAVSAKPELFKLKQFDVAIIDEASQILEPQMIGILPLVQKFILIGDHKQLPAVVLQNSYKSQLEETDLQLINLTNRSNSYFERLYGLCIKHQWTWAYDTLTYQGRMHVTLADFTNKYYYDGVLKPARPAQIADFEVHNFQEFQGIAPLPNFDEKIFQHLEKNILSQRLVFIPSWKYTEDKSDKIQTVEAHIITWLVKQFQAIYKAADKEFIPDKTLGIITPYRNQIAHLRNYLQMNNIEHYDKITIDTVERYQGSQRDIILISFCVNSAYQLKNLVAMTDDGVVDRKLNVALTRAREQMILVGNPLLLAQEPMYAKLLAYLEQCKTVVDF